MVGYNTYRQRGLLLLFRFVLSEACTTFVGIVGILRLREIYGIFWILQ